MALRNVDRNTSLPASLLRRFAGARPDGAPPAETPTAAGPGRDLAARPAGDADRLDLSAGARRLERLQGDLAAARESLAALPETRSERVAQARARLAEGAYRSEDVQRSTAARLGSVLRRLEDLID